MSATTPRAFIPYPSAKHRSSSSSSSSSHRHRSGTRPDKSVTETSSPHDNHDFTFTKKRSSDDSREKGERKREEERDDRRSSRSRSREREAKEEEPKEEPHSARSASESVGVGAGETHATRPTDTRPTASNTSGDVILQQAVQLQVNDKTMLFNVEDLVEKYYDPLACLLSIRVKPAAVEKLRLSEEQKGHIVRCLLEWLKFKLSPEFTRLPLPHIDRMRGPFPLDPSTLQIVASLEDAFRSRPAFPTSLPSPIMPSTPFHPGGVGGVGGVGGGGVSGGGGMGGSLEVPTERTLMPEDSQFLLGLQVDLWKSLVESVRYNPHVCARMTRILLQQRMDWMPTRPTDAHSLCQEMNLFLTQYARHNGKKHM